VSNAPTFSFVVPTRNRAGLLARALASALAQTVDDFEVVVSNNASDDHTAATIDRIAADPRVRSVRTPRVLPQPDSWEFAFEHARGEWITLLSDDDAAVPSLLARVAAVTAGTAVVAYRKAWYVHPDVDPPWPYADEVNVLTARPWDGSVADVDARSELERFFRRAQREAIPGISNAFVRRDALERLRREAGRLFRYPDPAAVACAGLLALEPSYRAIDLPLNVEGISRTNVSSGYRHDLAGTHAVVREYHADELVTLAPLRSRTMATCEAESLLRAQAYLPGRFDDLALDPVGYFLAVDAELSRDGRDRRDDREEWRSVLASQPRAVRRAVGRAVARRRIHGLARRMPGMAGWRRRRHGGAVPGFVTVAGRDAGFDDVVGAARSLDGLLDGGRGAPALPPALSGVRR